MFEAQIFAFLIFCEGKIIIKNKGAG